MINIIDNIYKTKKIKHIFLLLCAVLIFNATPMYIVSPILILLCGIALGIFISRVDGIGRDRANASFVGSELR